MKTNVSAILLLWLVLVSKAVLAVGEAPAGASDSSLTADSPPPALSPVPGDEPRAGNNDHSLSGDQSPPAPPKEPPRVVMARVADQEITVQDLMNYITKKPHLLKEAGNPAGKMVILREMIIEQLMKLAMRREGLLPEKPTQDDYTKGYQKLVAKHFPAPTPSEEEAYHYYLAHQQDYGIPPMLRISQIQFRFPPNADEQQKAAVRHKAEQAWQRLEKGESFADVARELTEHPQAKVTGGDLGFNDPTQDPWLQQALQGLQVGDRTGVIESPVGYDILLITDDRKGIITPFPNVRQEVITRMRREVQLAAREAYAKELQKTFPVTIVQEQLKDQPLW